MLAAELERGDARGPRGAEGQRRSMYELRSNKERKNNVTKPREFFRSLSCSSSCAFHPDRPACLVPPNNGGSTLAQGNRDDVYIGGRPLPHKGEGRSFSGHALCLCILALIFFLLSYIVPALPAFPNPPVCFSSRRCWGRRVSPPHSRVGANCALPIARSRNNTKPKVATPRHPIVTLPRIPFFPPLAPSHTLHEIVASSMISTVRHR